MVAGTEAAGTEAEAAGTEEAVAGTEEAAGAGAEAVGTAEGGCVLHHSFTMVIAVCFHLETIEVHGRRC